MSSQQQRSENKKKEEKTPTGCFENQKTVI
jgi:hypothetical protein